MKNLLLFVFACWLAGCTAVLPVQKQAVPQDLTAFAEAFDMFQTSNRYTGLQQFMQDYPNSAWAVRAGTIVLYAQELDQRKQQIADLRGNCEQQELALDQQEQDLQDLQRENQQLAETIEQLKGLLIQLEQRPQ